MQRLQRDPELAGVDVVRLLDECHERHLDADTAPWRRSWWTCCRGPAAGAEADRGHRRRAIAEAWAELLTVVDGSGPAPIVRSEGEGHGYAVRFAAPPAGIRPAHGTWVDSGAAAPCGRGRRAGW
ncbi:hypothetical protein [Streptomyces narbonensis]